MVEIVNLSKWWFQLNHYNPSSCFVSHLLWQFLFCQTFVPTVLVLSDICSDSSWFVRHLFWQVLVCQIYVLTVLGLSDICSDSSCLVRHLFWQFLFYKYYMLSSVCTTTSDFVYIFLGHFVPSFWVQLYFTTKVLIIFHMIRIHQHLLSQMRIQVIPPWEPSKMSCYNARQTIPGSLQILQICSMNSRFLGET
jgi:hypothetical protein